MYTCEVIARSLLMVIVGGGGCYTRAVLLWTRGGGCVRDWPASALFPN